MWTDRQAGVTNLIVAFRNFAKAQKKILLIETTCLLPSSVDGHVSGVVYTFLALDVSHSQRGLPSVAYCIDTKEHYRTL
jgi:hypothetical protein